MIADRNAAARNAFANEARDRRPTLSSSPYLAHVMEVEDNAQRSSEELPKLVAGYTTKASYPATGLGRSLALAAQIVGSNLGTKAIYVEHGSFDTHVSQNATQNRLLTQFSERDRRFLRRSRRAWQRAARFDAHVQRVRPAHRRERQPRHRSRRSLSALPDRRRRQRRPLRNALPDLAATNMGNVRYTVDFRSVYATVLERWLGRPSATVLNGAFAQATRAWLA